MTEKPEPVSAWGVYDDKQKLPIAVYETEQQAKYRAMVFREDSVSVVRVIPVTITAKDE